MSKYQMLPEFEQREIQSKLFDAISKNDTCYTRALEVIELARLLGVYDKTKYGMSVYNNENS